MADYLTQLEASRVVPDVKPGEIRARLPVEPPLEPEPFDRILQDFRSIVVPGMTHWQHPSFFAYFPANNSPPSILAEMLTAAMGAQCMSWQTSPAATELEQLVMDWLRQMLGLPSDFTGVIQDTASTATLVALLSARERATEGGFARLGAAAAGADRLTVYASEQAHSSVEKGVRLAGFGLERLRYIPVNEVFAMRCEALEASVAKDLANGFRPTCVVATIGTTSSTAVDPLGPISELCHRHRIWLHVDAAYAGSAAILPERRGLFEGVEGADSFSFNPHKWLFTNFDCAAYFVRDVSALLRACAITPEYLRTSADAEVVNFRDWGIPLGRRFRALKLWFVIRSFGVEGLRKQLRAHLALAQEFRSWVQVDPDFEVVAPTPFALVCFRYRPKALSGDSARLDALNEQILASLNASGRVFLTHTRLAGRYVLRLSVGALATQREHVRAAWEELKRAAGEIP